MEWDFYLVMKVGGIALFIFAGGNAASKTFAISRSKTYLINTAAVFAGYALSTAWYLVQNHLGGDREPLFPLNETWPEAGAVLYGWVLGGTAAIVFLTRKLKIDTVRYLDAVLPLLLLAQMMNRLGCFDAGCCFGSHTTGPVYVEDFDGGRIHPVQMYEALFDFVYFIFVKSREPKRGRVTFLYFTGYPIARFFFEILRGDNGPALLGMTVPQITSLLILATVFRLKAKILQK